MIDPDIRMIATDEMEAARLSAALKAITPGLIMGTTDALNHRVRNSLRRDELVRRRWIGRVFALSSLAAAIVLAFCAQSFFGPQSASAAIAWADVVKAMGQVDAVHMFEYWEKGDRNMGGRIDRVDTYYRRPGMWRGQGFGAIHFLTPTGERIYDVEKRKFVGPKSVLMKPLNVDDDQRFRDGPLLDSILQMLFRGKVPEPVHGQVGSKELEADLEVFEYPNAPQPGATVRIWVAKVSRLPLRVDLLSPDRTDISCHLEYGAALPIESFDAEHFASEIDRQKLTQPEQIFRVGLP